LMLLDQEGICASAGAACASGAPQASHVLLAMGVDADVARGALRLTLSTSTTDEEVAVAERALTQVLSKLS
jgi:cysteine desulfurase